MGIVSSVCCCFGSGCGDGGRWNGRFKAVSPFSSFSTSGGNLNGAGRSGNDLSGSSSMVSGGSTSQPQREEGEILQSSILKSFTFGELRTATRGFRPDNLLGEGGFGPVFKGWIDENSLTATKPNNGIAIAVKKLRQDGLQGHDEWLKEVTYLGQLHHPNLVKLIGYCLEGEDRLLVYEFMSRGSVENHLFGRSSSVQRLPWNLRMKVALEAAKGLSFLHSAEPTIVIYRDFKTANILLDQNYNAKLSDFGLAKDGPSEGESHVSTRVMGTQGYAAPEYVATGHLSTKSDVYGFGVVLLEILAGRRAIDKNCPPGQHNLVEWARPYLAKHKIYRVMDPHLRSQYSQADALEAALLARRCISLDVRRRPSMARVVRKLEELQQPNPQGVN